MRTMFLVQGNTGEFSDRSNWNVCGYLSRAKAELRTSELNAVANELMPQRDDADDEFWSLLEEATKTLRLHDPAGYMDYTGTWYEIVEVDVAE